MSFSPLRRAGFGVVLLLSLAGCQTGPSLSTHLHAYVGQPESALVQGLGVPNRMITTGGIKFLAYDWQTSAVIPGQPAFAAWGWGGFGPWGGGWYSAPTVVSTGCEATFQMGSGDVVMGVTLRGNGCE
jgi:hypothetical protein